MKIPSCGGCGDTQLATILKLKDTPLADRFSLDAATAMTLPKYPLELVFCPRCTLVQLGHHVPDAELYGSDYAFFTGSSPALVKHFLDYSHDLKERFPDEINRGVIEIASNDGTLLRHFKNGSHLGIDPAGPPSMAAKRKGLEILQEPFTARLARELVASGAVKKGRLVIANNVLAHVRDPHDIVKGIATLIGKTGSFVGEFQYLPDLLLGNNFDLVYHEHRYFYSLRSLSFIFERHGMIIVNAQHVPTQGGSVRITARSRGFFPPALPPLLSAAESVASSVNLMAFGPRVHQLIETIDDVLDRRDRSRPLVGYGASAKSCTLLHQLRTVPASIVDVTPYKVGRFSPGLALPIVHPDERDYHEGTVDYLSLIGNYAGSTIRREAASIKRGNRFLFPLPYPMEV